MSFTAEKIPQATFSVHLALTVSSHEFLKEVIEILWSFQYVCKLMEVEVRHEDIFGISCYVDHLKQVQSGYQQFTTLSCFRDWLTFNCCVGFQSCTHITKYIGSILHYQSVTELHVHDKTNLGSVIGLSVLIGWCGHVPFPAATGHELTGPTTTNNRESTKETELNEYQSFFLLSV